MVLPLPHSLQPLSEDPYGRLDLGSRGVMARSAAAGTIVPPPAAGAQAAMMSRSGGSGTLGMQVAASPGPAGRHQFATFQPAASPMPAGRPPALMSKSAPAEGLEYHLLAGRPQPPRNNNNNYNNNDNSSNSARNANDNAANNGTSIHSFNFQRNY